MNNKEAYHFIRLSSIRKFCLSVLLSILPFLFVFSQSKNFYSKDEMIQDIDILVQDIEAIHPNAYHSISKNAFYAQVKVIKDQIPDSISKIDAWRKINTILPLMKEGHTYIRPPEESIGDFLRFPFSIKIDNEAKNLIISNSPIDSLKRYIGERIVSINGIATDSLITIFHKNTSAENDALFVFMNETHIDYALYSIFGSPKYFNLILLIADKKLKLSCRSIKHIPDKIVPDFTFEMIHKNVGFIDMNRLNSLNKFKKFCKKTFRYLNKNHIGNLIIDFRGNGGGDSKVGDELIKYLSKVPFTQYQKAIIKVSSASKQQFHYPQKEDTLIEIEFTQDKLIEPYPEKMRYSGTVFILIDGGTYSSAGSTVWCINHYHIATTIGKETGGTGVHYGYPIKRKLPNSGLSYYISHIKWYQIGADDSSTHGLIPDDEIVVSIEDIKNNNDSAVDFVMKLIRQAKMESDNKKYY